MQKPSEGVGEDDLPRSLANWTEEELLNGEDLKEDKQGDNEKDADSKEKPETHGSLPGIFEFAEIKQNKKKQRKR